MKIAKYLLVFIIPALFCLGVFQGGWLSYGPLLFAFGLVPVLEFFFNPSQANIDLVEAEMRRRTRLYDFMLYLVVPVIFFCTILFNYAISSGSYLFWEKIGLTISMAILLGGLGINVAHELGHRNKRSEQWMALALLLPSAYMHFYVEHNQGHHKNVSTEEDPASSRRNETVYSFWFRSVVGSYFSAWRIENKNQIRLGRNWFNPSNLMIQYSLIQLAFWIILGAFFGWKPLIWFTAAAIGGFLLLETVNYIEHYGLRRQKVTANRYEKTLPAHSWNSNHLIGRMLLFELSRHSDHHFQPSKHYQLLDHHEESPQMPTGYPGMMLMSLAPPLWFALMNKRIPGGDQTAVHSSKPQKDQGLQQAYT